MQRPRASIVRLLAHWERRPVRLLAFAALGLALASVVLVPYGSPPDGDDGGRGPVATLIPSAPQRKAPPLVLPAPSRADREAQAVARLARRGQVIRGGGGARHLVALTFDDGPGPFTAQVVKALERLRAPATFFQVGRMLDEFPDAARLESESADVVIGDHSYTHGNMAQLSAGRQQQEILTTASAMLAHGEAAPRLFRPPYGLWNTTTVALTRRRGMAMVLWNVDSEDYTRPGVKRIVRTVLSEVRPGSIVLLHDAGGDRTQTVEALPYIVHALRRRGYGLVTVPELLAADPPDESAQPGEVRSDATPRRSPAPRTTPRPPSTGR